MFGFKHWGVMAMPLLMAACGGGSAGSAAVSPQLQLAASPPALRSGAVLTLLWTGRAVDACQASGSWSGVRPASGSEALMPLAGEHTYTLECRGAGGSVRRSVNVSVSAEPAAPTLALGITPEETLEGVPAALTWLARDASACVASGSWSGARMAGGSQPLTPPAGEYEYILSCTGPGGSVSARATLRVLPRPVEPDVGLIEFNRVRELERGCCEAMQ